MQAALDFMRRLGALVGEPAETLPQARALAADFQLDGAALDALERTMDCLSQYGVIRGELELDFGLNRGLHYYTGLIFELHAPTETGEMIQICGGGALRQSHQHPGRRGRHAGAGLRVWR